MAISAHGQPEYQKYSIASSKIQCKPNLASGRRDLPIPTAMHDEFPNSLKLNLKIIARVEPSFFRCID